MTLCICVYLQKMNPFILLCVVAGFVNLAASDEVYTQPDGTRLYNPNDGYAAEDPSADTTTADSKVFDSYKDQLLQDYVGLELKIGGRVVSLVRYIRELTGLCPKSSKNSDIGRSIACQCAYWATSGFGRNINIFIRY